MKVQVLQIGEPHYDDPSLALLFSQLRSKTLQTAKGTSEISGRSEFNFVLQIARVFCRMGAWHSTELSNTLLELRHRLSCIGLGPRSILVVRSTLDGS